MSQYTPIKLYYWPLKARSYASQIVAAAGNVPLDLVTDHNIGDATFKATLPFGQLPYLEHGDIKMSQSNAILRYIGRLAGTEGTTDRFCFSEMLIEEAADLYSALAKANYNSDKSSSYKALFAEEFPKHLANIEKLAPSFTKDAKKLTGEYAIVCILDMAINLESALLDKYPLTKEFVKSTYAQSEFDSCRNHPMYFKLE